VSAALGGPPGFAVPGNTPLSRRRAPFWTSPGAYNLAVGSAMTADSHVVADPEPGVGEAVPTTAPPARLSTLAWWLLGPVAAWSLSVSPDLDPRLRRAGCRKEWMIASLLRPAGAVDAECQRAASAEAARAARAALAPDGPRDDDDDDAAAAAPTPLTPDQISALEAAALRRLRAAARRVADDMAAHLRLWMHRCFGVLLTALCEALFGRSFPVLLGPRDDAAAAGFGPGALLSDGPSSAAPDKPAEAPGAADADAPPRPVAGLARLRALEARGATLVHLPLHKSYLDFCVLPLLHFAGGVLVPHTASGQNLRLPGVRFVMARNGAFFIRRTLGGMQADPGEASVYKACLRGYCAEVLGRGLSVCVYSEGGRARDGRAHSLKLGLLGYLVDGALDGADLRPRGAGAAGAAGRSTAGGCGPVFLAPQAASYDVPAEEATMIRELLGRPKRKETTGSLCRALWGLGVAWWKGEEGRWAGGRLGRCLMSVGEPMSVDAALVTEARAALARGDAATASTPGDGDGADGPPTRAEATAALETLERLVADSGGEAGLGSPTEAAARAAAVAVLARALPRGSPGRQRLVAALAAQMERRLVGLSPIPASALVASACAIAAAARGTALADGVPLAAVGRAARRLEAWARRRGAPCAGLPDECGPDGDACPGAVAELAASMPPGSPMLFIEGGLGDARASSRAPLPESDSRALVRLRTTPEAPLHLSYRTNQLLPWLCREGIVAAAVLALQRRGGADPNRDSPASPSVPLAAAAAEALFLRRTLRRELDVSSLPRLLGPDADPAGAQRFELDDVEGWATEARRLAGRGGLVLVDGASLRWGDDATAPARLAALAGAALLAPSAATYVVAAEAALALLARAPDGAGSPGGAGLPERDVLRAMMAAVRAGSGGGAGGDDASGSGVGPEAAAAAAEAALAARTRFTCGLVPSVVVVSHALAALRDLGVLVEADKAASESRGPAAVASGGGRAPRPADGDASSDDEGGGEASVSPGKGGGDGEGSARLPRVESRQDGFLRPAVSAASPGALGRLSEEGRATPPPAATAVAPAPAPRPAAPAAPAKADAEAAAAAKRFAGLGGLRVAGADSDTRLVAGGGAEALATLVGRLAALAGGAWPAVGLSG